MAYDIKGYRDTKNANWHAYTKEQVEEAKRLVKDGRRGFSDFEETYARDLLPLVCGMLFNEVAKKKANGRANKTVSRRATSRQRV